MPLTVKSVRRVRLEEPVPVYDLTSEHNENFALANGTVVHNSAMGSAMNAKMEWQEILPLRGKLPNLVRRAALVKNEIVSNIINVVGYDARNPDRPLRVGRIVLLTDADDDGDHIAVLLLTVLHRVMPEVIHRGLVHLVDAPLFEAMNSRGVQVTGNSLRELKEQHGRLVNVNRMKGWGGCESPLLREIAFDPATRTWLRLAAPSEKEVVEFEELLGTASEERKRLIGTIGSATTGDARG